VSGRVVSERAPGSNGDLPPDGARVERHPLAAEIARPDDAYERTLRISARASAPRAASEAFDEGDRLQNHLLRMPMRLRRCVDDVDRTDSAGVVVRLDSRRGAGRDVDGHEHRHIQPPPRGGVIP
jgi:hypothetical protein